MGGRNALNVVMAVRVRRGEPGLTRGRSTAGRRLLEPPIGVRIPATEPDVSGDRTAASTSECHSGHTGSSPVLRSMQGWRSRQRIGFVHRSPRLDSGFLLQIFVERKTRGAHTQEHPGS